VLAGRLLREAAKQPVDSVEILPLEGIVHFKLTPEQYQFTTIFRK
jgi:hypothetical protein